MCGNLNIITNVLLKYMSVFPDILEIGIKRAWSIVTSQGRLMSILKEEEL